IWGQPGRSAVPSLALVLMALGLLGLALLRQGLTMMDNERLRREREAELRETAVELETFLGVAGHELKNPLATMRLGLQWAERRLRRLLQRERVEATDIATLLEPVVQAGQQEERVERLVGDLLGIVRVQAGRVVRPPAPPG